MLSGQSGNMVRRVHICIVVRPASTTSNNGPAWPLPDNICQQNQNCHLLFSLIGLHILENLHQKGFLFQKYPGSNKTLHYKQCWQYNLKNCETLYLYICRQTFIFQCHIPFFVQWSSKSIRVCTVAQVILCQCPEYKDLLGTISLFCLTMPPAVR